MKTSLNGKRFLAAREALSTVPYRDGKLDNGQPRYSIGYGHLAEYGPDTPPIETDEAWDMLDEKIAIYEADVNRHLGKTPVTNQMFDALVSLYYNTGAGGKRDLIASIKAGDLINAGEIMMTMNREKNEAGELVVNDGLTRRRERERDLFLRGMYGDLSTVPVWRTDPRAHPRDYTREPMPG